MTAQQKVASEAAVTAPKARDVAPVKPTLVHSAPDRWGTTPRAKKSENPPIGEPFFECSKPGGYILRAQFETCGKTTYLDLRHWVERGDGLVRTRKGATIPLSRVRELGEALSSVNLPAAASDAQSAS
jgi:hypothetical protein